jgi:hypothetical protein
MEVRRIAGEIDMVLWSLEDLRDHLDHCSNLSILAPEFAEITDDLTKYLTSMTALLEGMVDCDSETLLEACRELNHTNPFDAEDRSAWRAFTARCDAWFEQRLLAQMSLYQSQGQADASSPS